MSTGESVITVPLGMSCPPSLSVIMRVPPDQMRWAGWFITCQVKAHPSADSSRNKLKRERLRSFLLHFYCTDSQVIDYQWSG